MPNCLLGQFYKGSTTLSIAARTTVRERDHQIQTARIEHIGRTWCTQREVERTPGEWLIRRVAREGLSLGDLALCVAHRQPLGATDKRSRGVHSAAAIALEEDAGRG